MGVVFQKSTLPTILHFARVVVAPLPHVINAQDNLLDSDMFRYCSTKPEILLQFGENYGILNNLKKRKQFYVLLLMAPLQAPLVTFGIVIKSKLQ